MLLSPSAITSNLCTLSQRALHFFVLVLTASTKSPMRLTSVRMVSAVPSTDSGSIFLPEPRNSFAAVTALSPHPPLRYQRRRHSSAAESVNNRTGKSSVQQTNSTDNSSSRSPLSLSTFGNIVHPQRAWTSTASVLITMEQLEALLERATEKWPSDELPCSHAPTRQAFLLSSS